MASAFILSSRTRTILNVFGSMIRAARLERKMPQAELAERLGVSRQTVSSIEKGDAKVAVGTVFEAAAVVGIPLLAESTRELQHLSGAVANLAQLLPERAHANTVELDNDF
jgi:transcriptional regulator with XRE-family HTH domain